MKRTLLFVFAISVSSFDLFGSAVTRLVPVFAENIPGANGSLWRSEIRLFNSSDESQAVTVARIFPFPGNSCSGAGPITLAAGALGLIRSAGCGSGAAALEIVADEAVVVESVVINVGGTAQQHPCCPSGFQQAISVRPVDQEYAQRRTVANLPGPITGLPGPLPTQTGRHNLGFVNPNPFSIVVTLGLFHFSGNRETGFDPVTISVEPFSLMQRPLVLPARQQPFETPIGQEYWRVTASSDSNFAMYDSYVDNATNDGTFIQSH